jgi:hypothetical protein
MVRWFITVFLMLLPLLLLGCGNGEAVTESGEAVTHSTIPKALEGSDGQRVNFRQVFISLAPEPVLVLDGSKWGFQVYHEGALKGQGTMLVYVDADAISFQLKPGESVKVEGVLVKSKTQVTVGASAVERLSCNDTNSCR